MYNIVDETVQKITEGFNLELNKDNVKTLKVKDWYFDHFCDPTEVEGGDIEAEICKNMNPDITFIGLLKGMTDPNKGIYELIDIGDSDVETRIREGIADGLGIDYNIIYNAGSSVIEGDDLVFKTIYDYIDKQDKSETDHLGRFNKQVLDAKAQLTEIINTL